MAEPGAAGAKAIGAAIGAAAGAWLFGKVKAPQIGAVVGGVVGAWIGERLGPVVMKEGSRLGKRVLVVVRRKPALPSP